MNENNIISLYWLPYISEIKYIHVMKMSNQKMTYIETRAPNPNPQHTHKNHIRVEKKFRRIATSHI